MRFIRSCMAALLLGFAVFLQSTVAYAAADITNGSSCFAANLNQAFELRWNQARVLNPADNTNTRFVVCNISAGPKIADVDPAITFTLANSGSIAAFFDEDADPNAAVSCVIREISSTQTGNAGQDQLIIEINPPAILPGTATGSFASDDGIAASLNVFNGSANAITFVCSLPPGTGIQQMIVNNVLAS